MNVARILVIIEVNVICHIVKSIGKGKFNGPKIALLKIICSTLYQQYTSQVISRHSYHRATDNNPKNNIYVGGPCHLFFVSLRSYKISRGNVSRVRFTFVRL